jgi:glycosyltransferase involved in cell wall biosynthesis
LLASKICAKLSRYEDVVAYNGNKARQVHEEVGYDSSKSVVLLNGCDTEIYQYIPDSRNELAQIINSDRQNKNVVLSISRYNPIKDIPNFVRAISLVKEEEANVVAVMCGKNISNDNSELLDLIKANGLIVNKDVFLLGQREDLPVLLSAADLYVLHSASEAFPNTLIEAMACETNCVATDVGEVAKIIGAGVRVVPPKDSERLAAAIVADLKEENEVRKTGAANNRATVVERFSIQKIVREYENLFFM